GDQFGEEGALAATRRPHDGGDAGFPTFGELEQTSEQRLAPDEAAEVLLDEIFELGGRLSVALRAPPLGRGGGLRVDLPPQRLERQRREGIEALFHVAVRAIRQCGTEPFSQPRHVVAPVRSLEQKDDVPTWSRRRGERGFNFERGDAERPFGQA